MFAGCLALQSNSANCCFNSRGHATAKVEAFVAVKTTPAGRADQLNTRQINALHRRKIQLDIFCLATQFHEQALQFCCGINGQSASRSDFECCSIAADGVGKRQIRHIKPPEARSKCKGQGAKAADFS